MSEHIKDREVFYKHKRIKIRIGVTIESKDDKKPNATCEVMKNNTVEITTTEAFRCKMVDETLGDNDSDNEKDMTNKKKFILTFLVADYRAEHSNTKKTTIVKGTKTRRKLVVRIFEKERQLKMNEVHLI